MYLNTDKALLGIFVASVVLVSFSVLLVPLTMEDPVDRDHLSPHIVIGDNRFPKKSSVADKDIKKRSGTNEDRGSSRVKDDIIPNIKASNEKSEKKGHFLKKSSPYHTIFSSGCSIYQDWQSYAFFYHVVQSGQEGHITRIVSGCSEDDEVKLQGIFDKEIESMNPGKLHLHLTPDFSNVPKEHKGSFKYFNKPFGVRHWMEHALGYPDNHELHDDSIIILMDPDQIMLRPFTNDFTNSSEKWKLHASKRKSKVEHGAPFAQQYGYGIQWYTGGRKRDKIDPEYVFQDGRLPTPVSNVTRQEVKDYYSAMGPPYIATAKDMWEIANTWSDIVPKVHDKYPHLLAEMFAYNFAIAHLGLRHTLAHSFMVSDPWAGGEGWGLIDNVNETNICKNFPKSEYPHVIHYCQKYYIGSGSPNDWWYFSKKKLPNNFISCEAPLLKQPPDDLSDYKKYNKGKVYSSEEIKEWKPKQAKEEAFMLCEMIRALNDAAIFYKDQHCKDGTGNYGYSDYSY